VNGAALAALQARLQSKQFASGELIVTGYVEDAALPALYRQAPIVYVYDDHDFGRDDSDGTSVTKAAAQLVYRERVPHYPLPLSTPAKGAPAGAPHVGPIAQAFDVGRARVIVTDGRSERTPQNGRDVAARSMLGGAQRAWFRDELTRAADTKAPVVFWGCGVPWITKASPTNSVHGWHPYQHERAEIAGLINKLGLTSRLVILSGDAHMAAIDDGTNSNYVEGTAPGTKGPVVVQAAPFSRFPRSKGVSPATGSGQRSAASRKRATAWNGQSPCAAMSAVPPRMRVPGATSGALSSRSVSRSLRDAGARLAFIGIVSSANGVSGGTSSDIDRT